MTASTAAAGAHWLMDPAAFGRALTRNAYQVPRWIDHVSRLIARESAKGGARLAISVPPQHGKSLLASGLYPAWRLERDPRRRIGVVSYAETLAARSVRYGRDLIRERQDILRVRLGKSAEEYYETLDSGGVAPGYVRAMGITGSITGFGFDDLVIDDPYASLAEASSETIRAKVREAFWAVLMTRLAKGGNVIGIMTRWVTNDLFGELIADGVVREIRLPAIAEEDDPLGRAPGEAIWPELHPLSELEALRAKMPPSIWAALYQGRPLGESGGIFRRAWFEEVAVAPELVTARVRYWDPAASRKQNAGDPDYAVGTLMSKARGGPIDGAYVVEHIDRDRGTALDLERRIVAAAKADGRRVRIRIEEEPGSQGAAYVAHLTRLLAGWDVRGVKHGAGADKRSRAMPFAAQMEVGNVRWVRGPWLEQAKREMEVFVGDGSEDHDDVPDSVTGAFEDLAGAKRWPWESAAAVRTSPSVADDRNARDVHEERDCQRAGRERRGAVAFGGERFSRDEFRTAMSRLGGLR